MKTSTSFLVLVILMLFNVLSLVSSSKYLLIKLGSRQEEEEVEKPRNRLPSSPTPAKKPRTKKLGFRSLKTGDSGKQKASTVVGFFKRDQAAT